MFIGISIFGDIINTEKAPREKGKSLISLPDEYVIIDTETTGLDTEYCGIIEIAAIKYKDGDKVSSFSELVRPNSFRYAEEDDEDYCVVNGEKIVFIDSFISELTGITNRMLQDVRSQEEVFSDFLQFVGDSVVIGHNVNFDVNFIYDAVNDYLGKTFSNDFIDTMRIARKLLKEDLKHHRLCDIAKYYDIKQENAHRALADCETTNQCYVKMRDQILKVYGNAEAFCSLFNKHNQRKLSAKDIVPDSSEIDEDSPIYGKLFVFTGALDRMLRKDAMQLVVNKGGLCGDNITKKTNFLVLGNNDFCSSIKDGKSNKQKKAEALKLAGNDIEIISENVFYEMLGE